jgi:hypothetical protein
MGSVLSAVQRRARMLAACRMINGGGDASLPDAPATFSLREIGKRRRATCVPMRQPSKRPDARPIKNEAIAAFRGAIPASE